MRMSVLEMVQDILSEMDSDEVNSIDDTIEAGQVATIIKNTYLLMCSNRNWGDEKKLVTLDHIGKVRMPTHLTIPNNIKQLDYLAYDCTKEDGVSAQSDYRTLKYKLPDEFLRACQYRPNNNQNYVEVIDSGGVKLFIKNNAAPSYWTSFDDNHIICDSYDANVDTTLKASKTQAMVVLGASWEYRDDFIPKLPIEAYAALLADAKSTAFSSLKQVQNAKAEMNAQKQQRWLARKNSTTMGGVRYQTFGRRSVK